MKVVITGMNGTLAPKVANCFDAKGIDVIAWDRSLHNPDDRQQSSGWLDSVKPDAVVHLALGSVAWCRDLAEWTAAHGVPLVYVSTAMVFSNAGVCPHQPDHERTGTDEYGRYKIACEDAVQAHHPGAIIARIGWQMDADGLGNNMIRQLDDWQNQEGRIEASRLWVPACSFMTDTAVALWKLLADGHGGVYHLDANAQTAWNFPSLVRWLAGRLDRSWTVHETEAYQHDQRLLGSPGLIPNLGS